MAGTDMVLLILNINTTSGSWPTHRHLYLWERGGWVGIWAGLDECGEKKVSCPHRDLSPEPSSPLRVAISAPVAQNSRAFEVPVLPSRSKTKEMYKDNLAQWMLYEL
jgi:hypothetical protein